MPEPIPTLGISLLAQSAPAGRAPGKIPRYKVREDFLAAAGQNG